MQSIAFGDYLKDWLTIRGATVKPRTIESYTAACTAICAVVGQLHMEQLSPSALAAVYAPLVAAGKTRTAAVVFRVLSMALKDAVSMGMLKSSPMAALRMPKHKPKKVEAFTHAEIRALCASDPQHAFVWQLLWMTGARRGEACALRWSDVDFTKKVIHIRRQVVVCQGVTHETPPKSDTGIRSIPMDDSMVQLLRAQLRVQLQNGRSGDRIISNDGADVDPNTINRWLKQAAAHAGVKDAHPHRFRHTYGTDGVSAGVELRVLQYLMGHSDIAVTSKYYADVREDARQTAAYQLQTYRKSII